MPNQAVLPAGWVQVLLPIAVIAVVFAFRLRRMSQERPLKLERLWIVPTILLVLAAVTFSLRPPTATGWAVCAGTLLLGVALGYLRGRAMRITVDPQTHRLNHRASPLAMLILLLLIAGKTLAQAGGRQMHVDAALVTDAALAFALGLFAATQAEMYVRGKALLAQAPG
jgi:hypothetical protein